MKKKFLIISAIISLLLVCFPFTLCAEDAPSTDPGPPPGSLTPGLDSYFYSNYDLLPYIESDGSQYINTSIISKSNLRIDIRLSDPVIAEEDFYGFYGAFGTYQLYSRYYTANDKLMIAFGSTNAQFDYQILNYNILSIVQDNNKIYLNGNLVNEFENNSFTDTENIFIFALSRHNGPINYGSYKLHSFKIYDYDSDAYVRYYYPAKAKSGGTIGLYDTVSKTFITTSGNVPFENPTDDKVLHFQIGDFITAGLGWIGDILDFAIAEPLIICFMAIGLAGAMFRWARRLVHF